VSRRAKHQAHENHERWLVSYADFITLMFAFFVVMFAASQTDKDRARQVSESVTKALEEGRVSAAVASMLGKTDAKAHWKGAAATARTKPGADPQIAADLVPSLEYLTAELKQEIAAGKLQLRLEPRGLIVSLTEAAFFPSGEDTIDANAYTSIEKIAVVIKKLPNPVRLEGHTDAVPIHNSRFRSNWELSAARGIAMLELLKSHCGVEEKQLAMAGYADTSPVDSNDTEAGRARNRRVDVVILTKAGYAAEPAGKPESPKQAAALHKTAT
jgi:chemotaxis protein MotB